jgi:type VI secretion system protein ImpI
MALTLKVENETSLPDGGPLSVTIRGKRGIDIGRDSHLDWTLPDPTRFISGKHCEIRFKDGAYWLCDVSTNGTFLNGADQRMHAPHLLRSGDRFVIGNYIVAANVEDEVESGATAPQGIITPDTPRSTNYQELWTNEGSIPPPIDSKQLKTVELKQSGRSDFLDWAADIPSPVEASPLPAQVRPVNASDDPDWAWTSGPPSQASPPPAIPVQIPTPRRRSRNEQEDAPWDEELSLLAERTSAAKMPSAVPTKSVVATIAAAEPFEFQQQLAKSAGLPENFFEQKDAAELAQQLGEVLRLVAENLMQLLSARAQAKRLARSSSHTIVQATENNPLKFAPSAQDALHIMFGPATKSYLNAQRAIEQGFEDLKRHQIKTYSAMQHAVRLLMADFGPQSIEQSIAEDHGITRLLTSRNAKLWEAYVARWRAKVREGDFGPIEAFMLYFAEYYEREGGETPPRT